MSKNVASMLKWAKQEGQFQLQLLLCWYGVILRFAIDFRQAVKFQVKWPQAELLNLLVELKKLDNISFEWRK